MNRAAAVRLAQELGWKVWDTYIQDKPHPSGWYVQAMNTKDEDEGTTPEDVARSIKYLRDKRQQ